MADEFKDAGINGHKGLPPGKDPMRFSTRLANEIGNAPVMVLCAPLAKDPAVYASVVPSAQIILQAPTYLRYRRHYCHPTRPRPR